MRCRVRIDDAPVLAREEEDHRRRLEHGLEHEVALVELVVFRAKRLAERVEAIDERAHLVASRLPNAEGEIALREAEEPFGDGADRRERWAEDEACQGEGERRDERDRGEERGER